MKLEDISFQHRGKTFSGRVAIPESLSESVEMLGEKEVFDCFSLGYLEMQKIRMRRKRVKRFHKIDVSELTDEQKEILKSAGILGKHI